MDAGHFPGMVLAILQIVTVLVLCIAMTMSLAHALEFPGKLRLSKDDYFIIQQIYYPGFTFGGAAEPVAIALLVVLLLVVPPATPGFWLTAFALLATAALHATYWLVTHPVNRAWVKNLDMGGLGTEFFGTGSASRRELTWIELRDRWEYSHLLRALLAFAALAAMVVSLRISP